jgi:hypothetical protein
MFTWICPQCGREVPPAYTECPDCSRKTAPADAVQAEEPPPSAAPPAYSAPPPTPQYQTPPQPAAQPQYLAPPPPRGGLPTWALTLLFAFAFLGLGSGVYWLVSSRGANAKPTTTVESPAAKPGAKTSPYQKYIEISGVRFVEGKKKGAIEVRFIITNHSNADIPSLGGNVTIWGRTRNAEEDATGTFTFKTDLKGNESKDLTTPLTTKKVFIELPDWQNVSTDVQITSPD